MNVQWVKTSERKPPKGEYFCLCGSGNGYWYYSMILRYGLKSEGNIYYSEEDDGPDHKCFYYDDPEWGFSEMFEGSVLYWLEGLEMPDET